MSAYSSSTIVKGFAYAFTLLTALFVNLNTLSAQTFSGGNGSESTPYLISSRADMDELSTTAAAGNTYDGVYFKVTNDIDMGPTSFTPIGNTNQSTRFSGIFDGDSKIISNLYIDGDLAKPMEIAGLFGGTIGARLLNINLTNVRVYSKDREAGALVGRMRLSTIIDNCHASGTVGVNPSTSDYEAHCGGLVGDCSEAEIRNSTASVNISVPLSATTSSRGNRANVGGLIGKAYDNVTVKNCHATGNLIGHTVGGLIGCIQHDAPSSVATVTGCSASGTVSSPETNRHINTPDYADGYAGGLIGSITCQRASTTTISSCFTKGGMVSGTGQVAGFIANAYVQDANCNVSLTNCTSFKSVIHTAPADDKSVVAVGGFVGESCAASTGSTGGAKFENCMAAGTVTSSPEVTGWEHNLGTGGFAGLLMNESITQSCCAKGDVSGGDYIGGFSGINNVNSTISNCYAIGTVTGDNRVGGFIGENRGTISYSFSANLVTGATNKGGFAGTNSGTFTGCYYNSTTAGATGVGSGTTTGLTAQTTNTLIGTTFFNTLNGSQSPKPWKYDHRLNQTYPSLAWQDLYPLANGAGTQADPWQIASQDDLDRLAWYVNTLGDNYYGSYFKVMNDIDITRAHTPIGCENLNRGSMFYFAGFFNGNHKTITWAPGASLDTAFFHAGYNYAYGIFGKTGCRLNTQTDANIRDLTIVVNAPMTTPTPTTYFGALIGSWQGTGGQITNCNGYLYSEMSALVPSSASWRGAGVLVGGGNARTNGDTLGQWKVDSCYVYVAPTGRFQTGSGTLAGLSIGGIGGYMHASQNQAAYLLNCKVDMYGTFSSTTSAVGGIHGSGGAYLDNCTVNIHGTLSSKGGGIGGISGGCNFMDQSTNQPVLPGFHNSTVTIHGSAVMRGVRVGGATGWLCINAERNVVTIKSGALLEGIADPSTADPYDTCVGGFAALTNNASPVTTGGVTCNDNRVFIEPNAILRSTNSSPASGTYIGGFTGYIWASTTDATKAEMKRNVVVNQGSIYNTGTPLELAAELFGIEPWRAYRFNLDSNWYIGPVNAPFTSTNVTDKIVKTYVEGWVTERLPYMFTNADLVTPVPSIGEVTLYDLPSDVLYDSGVFRSQNELYRSFDLAVRTPDLGTFQSVFTANIKDTSLLVFHPVGEVFYEQGKRVPLYAFMPKHPEAVITFSTSTTGTRIDSDFVVLENVVNSVTVTATATLPSGLVFTQTQTFNVILPSAKKLTFLPTGDLKFQQGKQITLKTVSNVDNATYEYAFTPAVDAKYAEINGNVLTLTAEYLRNFTITVTGRNSDGIVFGTDSQIINVWGEYDYELPGDGTAANPYRIAWRGHLETLRSKSLAANDFFKNTYFTVVRNFSMKVDGTDVHFAPIANFKGSLDGREYTISDLYVNFPAPSQASTGLFHKTEKGAIIKNLTLSNTNMTGGANCGSLVGYAYGTTIDNCHASGTVTCTSQSAQNEHSGVLLGIIRTCSVYNCSSSGYVSSKAYAGGLIGTVAGANENYPDGSPFSCTIVNCHSSAAVVATQSIAGGLTSGAGTSDGKILVRDCYATGNVVSPSTGGGFAGNIVSNTTVENCYATGTVSGGNYLGGFAGYPQSNCIVSNCYATGNVEGNGYLGGFAGWISERSTIADCYATGNAKGTTCTGGFVGYAAGQIAVYNNASVFQEYVAGDLHIDNCYATGTATATGNYAGGFAGRIVAFAQLNHCYANGNSEAYQSSGGFVGHAAGTMASYDKGVRLGDIAGDVKINSCYAMGTSNGYGSGGFAGYLMETTAVNNCYGTGIASGDYNGGFVGILGDKATLKNCYFDKYAFGADEPLAWDYGEATRPVDAITGFNTWEMQTGWFVKLLGNDWTQSSDAVNKGYPIFVWQDSSNVLTPTLTTPEPTTYTYTKDLTIPLGVTTNSGATIIYTLNGTVVNGDFQVPSAGTYTFNAYSRASGNYTGDSTQVSVTVEKAAQIVNFQLLGDMEYQPGKRITLSSTVPNNPDAAITYTASAGAIENGNELVLPDVFVNPIIVTATAAGNTNYTEATASQRLNLTGETGAALLVFETIGDVKYHQGKRITLNASSSRIGTVITFSSSTGASIVNDNLVLGNAYQREITVTATASYNGTAFATATQIVNVWGELDETLEGDGTAANPYRIAWRGHLETIAARVNAGETFADSYFEVVRDFSMSINGANPSFTPIGYAADFQRDPQYGTLATPTIIKPFSGHLQGHGFTISDLYIGADKEVITAALFGATKNATILNLSVTNANVTGRKRTGILMGHALNARIENCRVSGVLTDQIVDVSSTVADRNSLVGGVAAHLTGTARNCYADVQATAPVLRAAFPGIESSTQVGGVAGEAVSNGCDLVIENCHATGSMLGNTTGGLIGCAYMCGGSYTFRVENCTASVNINAEVDRHKSGGYYQGFAGGIVGAAINSAQFINCHVTGGTVSGISLTGGFIGNTWVDNNTTFRTIFDNCSTNAMVIDPDSDRHPNTLVAIGGFIGQAYGVNATDCVATGNVTGSSNRNITAPGYGAGTGGFAGCTEAGTAFTGCRATGNVSGSYCVGGFLAMHDAKAEISNCSATGDILCTSPDGISTLGGFVGSNNGAIVRSYATGNVTGGNYTGGFAGIISKAAMGYCYSTGNVVGGDHTGGFAGYLDETTAVTLSYSGGKVSGTNYVGGFAGVAFDADAVIYMNYFDKYAAGTDNAFGYSKLYMGVDGLNTWEMQTDWLVNELCFVDNIWTQSSDALNKGYPIFVWQDPSNVLTPTLTTPEPTTYTYTKDLTIPLGVTTNSGATIIYTLNGEVVSGDFKVPSAGTYTFNAYSMASGDYAGASTQVTVTVERADRNLVFLPVGEVTYALNKQVPLMAYVEGEPNAVIEFSTTTANAEVVNGSSPYVILKDYCNTVEITATVVANANYNAAAITRSFNVVVGMGSDDIVYTGNGQSKSFEFDTAAGAWAYKAPTFTTLPLTSTLGKSIAYTVSDEGIATINAGVVTFKRAGTVQIIGRTADGIERNFFLTASKADLALAITGSALSSVGENAIYTLTDNGVASGIAGVAWSVLASDGAVIATLDISRATVAFTKAPGNRIIANVPETDFTKAGQVTFDVVVQAINQVITPATVPTLTYAPGLTVGLSATTSGDGIISFTSTHDSAIVTGNTLHIFQAGVYAITAHAAATTNYNAASADFTVTVDSAAQQVVFLPVGEVTYSANKRVPLTAYVEGRPGVTIEFKSLTAGVVVEDSCVVLKSYVSSVEIVAEVAADINYKADSVIRSFNVIVGYGSDDIVYDESGVSKSYEFNGSTGVWSYATPTFDALPLSSTLGRPITYTVTNASVATIDVSGNVTFKRAGTAQIVGRTADGLERNIYLTVTKANPVLVLNRIQSQDYLGEVIGGTAYYELYDNVAPFGGAIPSHMVTWSAAAMDRVGIELFNANTAKFTFVKPGVNSIIAYAPETDFTLAGLTTTRIDVDKSTQNVTADTIYLTYAQNLVATFAATTDGDGTISYVCSHDSGCIIGNTMYITQAGIYTVTAHACATDNCHPSSATFNVVVDSAVQQLYISSSGEIEHRTGKRIPLYAYSNNPNAEITFSTTTPGVSIVDSYLVLGDTAVTPVTVIATSPACMNYTAATAAREITIKAATPTPTPVIEGIDSAFVRGNRITMVPDSFNATTPFTLKTKFVAQYPNPKNPIGMKKVPVKTVPNQRDTFFSIEVKGKVPLLNKKLYNAQRKTTFTAAVLANDTAHVVQTDSIPVCIQYKVLKTGVSTDSIYSLALAAQIDTAMIGTFSEAGKLSKYLIVRVVHAGSKPKAWIESKNAVGEIAKLPAKFYDAKKRLNVLGLDGAAAEFADGTGYTTVVFKLTSKFDALAGQLDLVIDNFNGLDAITIRE